MSFGTKCRLYVIGNDPLRAGRHTFSVPITYCFVICHTYYVSCMLSGSNQYRLFRTSTNLSGAWYKFNVCRLRPTHFGLPAKVRQFFVLASIATMIAAAATVTTHHHHRNSYAPNLKVLCLCYGKTFCVGCIRVSIYFGTNRKFQHTSRAIAADFQR
jgi:hypothetical protein